MKISKLFLLEDVNVISDQSEKDTIHKIKRIEKKNFSRDRHAYQDIRSYDDIEEYGDSDTDYVVISEKNWYCVLAIEGDTLNVDDFSCDGKIDNIVEVLNKIKKHIPPHVRVIEGEFRSTTSYLLIPFLTRRGEWKVYYDEYAEEKEQEKKEMERMSETERSNFLKKKREERLANRLTSEDYYVVELVRG